MADVVSSPHGYCIATPYLTVSDANRFIEFMLQVLEASVIYENRYEDGSLQHARFVIGDSLFMANQASNEYPENESQIHIYVSDVDQTYKKALESGATSLMKPNVRPHGERMAGFKDPCGNRWWVASPV